MELVPWGPNQTIIRFSDGMEIFFSYRTPVAAFVPGTGYLKTEEKHSVMTSKHIAHYTSKRDCQTRPQRFFFDLSSLLER
jgi:hypothetical protein